LDGIKRDIKDSVKTVLSEIWIASVCAFMFNYNNYVFHNKKYNTPHYKWEGII
jgi:hypothetical protein